MNNNDLSPSSPILISVMKSITELDAIECLFHNSKGYMITMKIGSILVHTTYYRVVNEIQRISNVLTL